MDFLTALFQLCGFGTSCGTGCNTVANAATETANACGGFSGLVNIFSMVCKLFGLGC